MRCQAHIVPHLKCTFVRVPFFFYSWPSTEKYLLTVSQREVGIKTSNHKRNRNQKFWKQHSNCYSYLSVPIIVSTLIPNDIQGLYDPLWKIHCLYPFLKIPSLAPVLWDHVISYWGAELAAYYVINKWRNVMSWPSLRPHWGLLRQPWLMRCEPRQYSSHLWP